MHCCNVPPLREKDSNDVRITVIPSGLRSRCAANSVPKNLISNLSSAYLWLCPTHDAIFRTAVTFHWVTVLCHLVLNTKTAAFFKMCFRCHQNVIGLLSRTTLVHVLNFDEHTAQPRIEKESVCPWGRREHNRQDQWLRTKTDPQLRCGVIDVLSRLCALLRRCQYMNQAYADSAQVLRSTPATAEGHQLCWCLVPSELCLTVPPVPCKPDHQLPRTARCWTDGRRVVDAILVQLYFVFVWLLRKSRNAPQTR